MGGAKSVHQHLFCSFLISFTYILVEGTLTRKSIGPFADFSSKMAVFKGSENYLEDENFIKISSITGFTNGKIQFGLVFVQKFSLVQILLSVKVENVKKRPFY